MNAGRIIIPFFCFFIGVTPAFSVTLTNRATVSEYEYAVEKGTWVGNALHERYLVLGQTNYYLPESDSQHDYLQQLKNITKGILSDFVNLDVMGTSGLTGWYFGDGSNSPTTLPMFSVTSICAAVNAPSNYFDHTPERGLAEWYDGYTNNQYLGSVTNWEYVYIGGGSFEWQWVTNDLFFTNWFIPDGFTTTDYGWKYIDDIVKELVAIPVEYPGATFVTSAWASLYNDSSPYCQYCPVMPDVCTVWTPGSAIWYYNETDYCYEDECSEGYLTNAPDESLWAYNIVGPGSYVEWPGSPSISFNGEEESFASEYELKVTGGCTSYVGEINSVCLFSASERYYEKYIGTNYIRTYTATYDDFGEDTEDFYETYWDTNSTDRTREVYKYASYSSFTSIGVQTVMVATVFAGLSCPSGAAADDEDMDCHSFQFEAYYSELYRGYIDYSKHANGFLYK